MGGNQNPYEQYIQNYAASKDGGAGGGYPGAGGGYPPMPSMPQGYPGAGGGYPPMPQCYPGQSAGAYSQNSYGNSSGNYSQTFFC